MSLKKLTRAQRIEQIIAQPQWDLIVVGGGITGAGIFKLASQLGLKVLLVEQNDFAWGSSSRSSKMVHGGLRYMAQGQIKLTRESVKERQHLLTKAPHLVSKQSFAMSHFQRQFPWPWIFNCLLSVYDFFADDKTTKKQHQYHNKQNYSYLVPNAKDENSLGGTQFSDAMTDDARLVLRLIQEAQQLGGQAINYCKVEDFLFNDKENKQRITGVNVSLAENNQSLLLNAKVVVNATGAWATDLLATNDHNHKNQQPITLRPLRGSHIIVASWRLPVASAIAILHPQDKRPVQVFPWQNVTVIGTTDVEHSEALSQEPQISQAEFDYLLAAVDFQFPTINLVADDVISTFAGVRPVVASGGLISASKEKRDHSIWQQPGLVTIAGGKLTTFRVISQQVLHIIADDLALSLPIFNYPAFDFSAFDDKLSKRAAKKVNLDEHHYQHLSGCYGALTTQFIEQFAQYQLMQISYSRHLWAELVWAVHYEQVLHLDDLLLRRTRLGNVLPDGAKALLEPIKTLCFVALQWSESKWQFEVQRYKKLWKSNYSLPLFNDSKINKNNSVKTL
jgi:glycerol-3-phosphate dehydrogenase